MIDFVEKNAKKYPVLAMANTSNVGLLGHSYGGMTTVYNSHSRSDSRIKAAFNLHPCPCTALESFDKNACNDMNIDIPVAYATGSLDNVCSQLDVLNYFTKTKQKQKFFWNMLDIIHQDPEYEPPTYGHWDAWVGMFFNCHLKLDTKGCQYIDSNSLPDTLHEAAKFYVNEEGVEQFFSPLHPSPYH
jgi:hypothetical protein